MSEKEEFILVVYQTEESKLDMIDYIISSHSYATSIIQTENNLIMTSKYGNTDWYFKRYFSQGGVDEFIDGICGMRFNYARYLSGHYPSDLINFINSRCNLG